MGVVHLRHVAWDPSSASAAECAAGLVSCIVNGHFSEELKDSPGLVVRHGARITEFIAENYPLATASPRYSTVERANFEGNMLDLAGALGISVPQSTAGPTVAGSVKWEILMMIARQVAEFISAWLESKKSVSPTPE